MFYIWQNDFQYPAPSEVVIPDEWNEYDLFGGRRINRKAALPPMKLIYEKEVALSDSIPSRHIFLFFSERLVDFIRDNTSKNSIQAFPIEIAVKASRRKISNYYLVNVLKTKNVIDRKKSDLSVDPYGEINLIRRLQIIEEKADHCELFRMEGFSGLLLCSEELVGKIREKAFNGMKFISTEDFRR